MKRLISVCLLAFTAAVLIAAPAKKINPNVVENSDGSLNITNVDKDSSVKFNQKFDGFTNVTLIDGNKISKNNPITFDLSDFAGKEIMLQFSCDLKIAEENDEKLDLSWMVNDFEAGMPVISRSYANSNEWTTVKGEKVFVLGQKKSLYLSGAGLPTKGAKYYIKNLKLNINGEDLTSTPTPKVSWIDAPSIKEAYADYFDHFGIACTFRGELQLTDIQDGIAHQANSITMGNEFKPDFLFNWAKVTSTEDFVAEDGKTYKMPVGLPTFSTMNNCMMLAKMMGIQIRGHVLVWHSQTPDWFFRENFSQDKNANFVSKAEMNARMEWYIKTVLGNADAWEKKYNNGERIIYAWDVVNEAVSDGAGTQKWLREDSNWYRVYESEEFIINAFRYANKYAPSDVALVYNDYGCYSPGKRNAICNLVDEIKAVPDARINAVGMQSHVGLDTKINLEDGSNSFEEAVQAFVSHGVNVQVTELDIANGKKPNSPMLLKSKYKDYFKMFIRNRAKDGEYGITSVTVWGITDKGTWLNNQKEYKGFTQYPLLFNGDFTCKPAFYGVLEAAQED